ncbi:molybdenum cofactor sulfurase [Diplodia corticola]|uniref:Molybdenum cofactor sulfurase n=1 Tax=Diplodia corticola TaxID=236234 RepID=A0A1J9QVL9_9PEZI|nr:molybdenum cofactor sulfurase [Diplodia corticola]OJD32433.1 molybdenum cofactor sulfurase [Diplodia corticola]
MAAAYNHEVDDIRAREYPMLKDSVYLDHAGTTLYPKSLIDRFSADMVGNLYGNPHSASSASQLSARRIEDARLRLLRMFHADPEDFDVVFVANATAGVKLVLEAFRDQPGGFAYAYHRECHTSLVGVRELARQHRCFSSDAEVDQWLEHKDWPPNHSPDTPVELFAYPAQSNMNGRRLPLDWCGKARLSRTGSEQTTFSLLDAAAFVSTSPLDFRESEMAPDFTVLSLYKIFGFPDLGAMIVRKTTAGIFEKRRYFGGGTVDMVVCLREQWHAKKEESLHDHLEDGTLPIHSIMALHSAMDVHQKLFGSLERVSRHAMFLAKRLFDGLSSLRHGNGLSVCHIYADASTTYDDCERQGPIVAFNIRNSQGAWASNFEVERLASIKNIQLRTGSLCNPGGMAAALELSPWEMKENFSAGQRCGSENDVMGGKPTGMIRVSMGASSTATDVDRFLEFVREFFVETSSAGLPLALSDAGVGVQDSRFYVESLTIYPIKSCAGWKIPAGKAWEVRKEGLAWDREWCLVHRGSGAALSQKRYPRMALIRPSIDLEQGCLRVRLSGSASSDTASEICVPLSADPSYFAGPNGHKSAISTRVCGDMVAAQRYSSDRVSGFFSQALGVDCTLARFPAAGGTGASARHAKAHLQQPRGPAQAQMPGAFPDTHGHVPRPILLSNESPILVISRSSVNRLNEQIKAGGGKAAEAEVFRANVVVAERLYSRPGSEQPYAEDSWRAMAVGQQRFQLLGACRRCQMVCIDQQSGTKNEEPFVTLAKTRRREGKVYFGQHACHVPWETAWAQQPTISVGDAVVPE